tara:strand:- start:760 stop:993 length:234 start_codon:yes stop_codon:yes gene_type:complete
MHVRLKIGSTSVWNLAKRALGNFLEAAEAKARPLLRITNKIVQKKNLMNFRTATTIRHFLPVDLSMIVAFTSKDSRT